jgi:aminoglycoside phosphotransferase (APT) family kinase protein
MSVTMGRLLAAGQRAEVFEWGSRAVKLYPCAAAKQTAFGEAAIHAAVEVLGLPVPAIWGVQKISGRWGIVFDRVSGASFAEQMRSDAAAIPQYLQILARLHTRIHAHPANLFSSLKGWLATSITRAMPLDEPRKQILLNGLKDMPDGDRLCHGDFHPMNVLGDASQPIVIDWPNACRGDPAGDVCRSYPILKLHADEVAEPYLDAYSRVAGVPRNTILDCLAYVAAARLAEDVPGEQYRLLELVRSL